ncbi:ATP-binding cassette domain-containing protein [Motilimonas cestriensis]|uniref:ATP-binding cassette domain-containing protein n=1 Tax=Motilimonas cestriensis TaxID=2742685 RepID=A0ABS8WAZ6_9GAMM|nr:ATP-binding cassette domain-containing protein [Motilimonas cestriensis]MCE2596182.1 ATP-binding cassette domain-containing protein [Motilimonas cestriensis]
MSNYADPSSLASASVSAASSLLQVSGLSKSFDNNSTPIFSDVNFSIFASQSVALIGSNGAGKSTLLRCCLRLIEPDSGSIVFDGEAIDKKSGRSLSKVRNKVGFVFQKHCLVPRLSVLSNVIHGNLAYCQGPRNWLHGFARQEVRERAMDCLAQVGLAHLATKRCDQLSGGQSQRVAIARALMQQPTILFADEPTASLDPQSGQEIMELFERLVKDNGLTLFFVSHNIEHALKYADRVLGLQERRLSLDSVTHTQSLQSLRAFYG